MGLPVQIIMAAQSIVCQAMPVNRPAPSKAAPPQTGPLARPAGFSQVLSSTFSDGKFIGAEDSSVVCASLHVSRKVSLPSTEPSLLTL